MQIIHWNNTPVEVEETAVTMGFFDGVHRGHRFLIDQLKAIAAKQNLPTAIVTFTEHPRKVLQEDYQPSLLTTQEEKLDRLADLGIDYCFLIPFTKQFAKNTAQDFVCKILHQQLHAKLFLSGYDHKFGKGRTDNFSAIAQYGENCGIEVIQAGKYEADNNKFSSTNVRDYLYEGNVKKANELLSYNYTIEGSVTEGNHIGRKIGFPTANIRIADREKLIPQKGVYAVFSCIEGKKYPGMLYIGNRPTLPGLEEERIEVNIFDFDQDIYHQPIRIEFVDRIREDIHFNSLEELKNQLNKDRVNSIQALNS